MLHLDINLISKNPCKINNNEACRCTHIICITYIMVIIYNLLCQMSQYIVHNSWCDSYKHISIQVCGLTYLWKTRSFEQLRKVCYPCSMWGFVFLVALRLQKHLLWPPIVAPHLCTTYQQVTLVFWYVVHRLSMGFRSGDCAGQVIILFSAINLPS